MAGQFDLQSWIQAGDLTDESPRVEEFRRALKALEAPELVAAARAAAAGKTHLHQNALQDILNTLAAQTGLKVEFGNYGKNTRRPIEFAGFWQTRGGINFLFHLRVRGAQPEDFRSIARTLKKLNSKKQREAGVVIYATLALVDEDPELALEELGPSGLDGQLGLLQLETLLEAIQLSLDSSDPRKLLEAILHPTVPFSLEDRLGLISKARASDSAKIKQLEKQVARIPELEARAQRMDELSEKIRELEEELAEASFEPPAPAPAVPSREPPRPGIDPSLTQVLQQSSGFGTESPSTRSTPSFLQDAPSSSVTLSTIQRLDPIQELIRLALEAEETGRASEALDHWTAILEEDPENPQAREGFERAQRVVGGQHPSPGAASERGSISPYLNAAFPHSSPGGSASAAPEAPNLAGAGYPAPAPAPAVNFPTTGDPVQDGRIYLSYGHFLAAVPLFDQALTTAPEDPSIRRDLALALAGSGQVDRARHEAQLFLRTQRGSRQTLVDLCQSFVAMGRVDIGEDLAVDLLTQASDQAETYLTLGQVYHELGRPQESREHFQTASQMMAGSPEPPSLMAQCLLERGELEAAEVAVQTASAEDPNFGRMLATKGDLRRLTGDLPGARNLYQKAATLEPSLVEARIGLALIHEASGSLEEAAQLMEEVLPLDPTRRITHGPLLRILASAGRTERALQLAEYVLSFDPTSFHARVYRGITLYNLGRTAEATQALEAVRSEAQGDPQVLLYLGLCYFSQQDWGRAAETLEASTQQDPSLLDAYLYLGYSYCNLGNGMEAALNFSKVLNLDPDNAAAQEGMMSLG